MGAKPPDAVGRKTRRAQDVATFLDVQRAGFEPRCGWAIADCISESLDRPTAETFEHPHDATPTERLKTGADLWVA